MRQIHRHAVYAKQKIHKKPLSLLSKIFISVVVFLGILLFLKLNTKYWNGKDKLSFTFRQGNGDIGIAIADPKLLELTVMTIPAETQIEVARGFGTMRIKNVWQLAQNEGLDGRLMSDTVSQNFLFPVFLWSETEFTSLFKFIFFSGRSNIPLGDRIEIGLFVLKLSTSQISQIDLGKSQFLQKEILKDGEGGFVLSRKVSEYLTVYFSDNQIAQSGLRVSISDGTGKFGVSEKVGGIMEVLGGKVISIEKDSTVGKEGCTVIGPNLNINRKISSLFSCNKIKNGEDGFLRIILGTDFAKIF